MESSSQRGRVIVVSAPSGAGKHTILNEALARDPKLVYSISATTRSPRSSEVDGREYYFLDRETFKRRAAAGEFLEWAEVHGNLYGTLHSELDRLLDSGKDVLLELDVQGMRNVRSAGLDPLTIFIMPPSLEELAKRLRGRATDSTSVILVRLNNARAEIAAKDEFQHVIINDDIERAVAEFEAIVRAKRAQKEETPKQ